MAMGEAGIEMAHGLLVVEPITDPYRHGNVFSCCIARSGTHFGMSPFSHAAAHPNPSCRCLPGGNCWPKSQDWARLNNRVAGRLIATVPLAAPCHDPTYNAAECENITNLGAYPNLQ